MGSGSCFGLPRQPPSAPPPIIDPGISVHPGLGTRVSPGVIGREITSLGPQTMHISPGLMVPEIAQMGSNCSPFGGFGIPGYCGRGFGGRGFGSCGVFGGGFGGRF